MGAVETALEGVVDAPDLAEVVAAVDGLDLLELVAAAVEDPLAQIPGGDCNNQNCTAEENNCGALGHHLRGGQKCVQSVHLLWLTQSQNCSAAPRQLGALKYGAQLPTIVALVYCNC